jgi:predicted secreted Zn-dependent protease
LIAGALLCSSPVLAEKAGTETVKLAKYDEKNLFQLKKPEVALDLKEKHEYYEVRGTSLAELRKQMKENGTRWNDDHTYAALTTWNIKYDYDINESGGRYSIGAVKTKVDVVYRYPRLASTAGMTEQVAGQWSSYMEHVTIHEMGHKDLAVKAAAEVNEALSSLGTFGSRRELTRVADGIVASRLKKLNEDQIRYDAETHHGETQGAILR